MLRITVLKEASVTRFVVEGKLVGPWVGELRKCWETVVRPGEQPAVVDLTDVTFIDSHGKVLLTEMHRQGTQLVATGLMTQALVEDIRKSTL
jgi:anti-anti-sigma regulatory factor